MSACCWTQLYEVQIEAAEIPRLFNCFDTSKVPTRLYHEAD